MQVYRRSPWLMLKGIISAPCAGLLVFFAAGFFINDIRIVYGISVLVCLLVLFISVFSENIRLELDKNGELRYYKGGRLRGSYALEHCVVGYHRESDTGLLASHDIKLHILDVTSGEELDVDCSPLGLLRFEEMFTEIKQHTKDEPEILRARPAKR